MTNQRLEQRLRVYLAERAVEPAPIGIEERIIRQTLAGGRRLSAGQPWPVQLITTAAAIVLAIGIAIAVLQVRSHAPAESHPSKVKGPGVGVCYGTCDLGEPVFVSTKVGWLIESTTAPCNPTCPPRTSVLFRTDDGGRQWKAVYTWHHAVGSNFLASPNGRELLIGPDPYDLASPILYSSDGGAGWTAYGFPPSAGQAVETVCKAGMCGKVNVAPQIFFLNPHDGWLLSQEQTYNIADLFRTTDSGAHWQRVARIDVKAEFNMDPATGLTSPNGVLDHALGAQGQLVFQTSSAAWFVADSHSDNSASLYRSLDGGATWRLVTILRPPPIDQGDTVTWTPKFFNDHEGIVELLARPTQGPVQEIRYVYSTTDGGNHWSTPVHVPNASDAVPVFYIDAAHWVGWPIQGGWIRTSDAGQHWDVIPASRQSGSVPVSGSGLPPDLSWPRMSFNFLTPSHGWAYLDVFPPGGGTAGMVLYQTTDGGVNWTPLSLPELQ
jgi:photosystem II stability/assembly factor-like uncharacterized protein